MCKHFQGPRPSDRGPHPNDRGLNPKPVRRFSGGNMLEINIGCVFFPSASCRRHADFNRFQTKVGADVTHTQSLKSTPCRDEDAQCSDNAPECPETSPGRGLILAVPSAQPHLRPTPQRQRSLPEIRDCAESDWHKSVAV